MSPEDIKHFLLTYETASGKVKVESFGTDYDAAQAAYAKAEEANGFDAGLDIVLLGADSLETIEKTHSSYFSNGTSGLEELLPS